MGRAELIAAALLIATGSVTIVVLIPRFVASDASGGLSPAFMPNVAAVLLTLAAAGWAIALLRDHAGAEHSAARSDWRFVAAATGVLAGSCAITSAFGYLAGGVALVAGILALARVRGATLIATAVLAPLGVWFLLARLLATPLP